MRMLENGRRMSLAVVIVAVGVFAAQGDVVRATSAVAVDGKLDERAWKDAQWERQFRRLAIHESMGAFSRPTEFAIVHDGRTLYVGVRCRETDFSRMTPPRDVGLWGCPDTVEFFFSPTGNFFDHYHFAVSPESTKRYVAFCSEGGDIQPDPYAPVWQSAFGREKDGWTVELAIPLSAFYMTRNADWKGEWLMNVARTLPARPECELATWAPLERVFNEPKNFAKMDGFPIRGDADDFAVRSVFPEIVGTKDGRIQTALQLDVFTAVAGDYEAESSFGAGRTSVRLAKGDNRVTLPCAYPENGRHLTHLAFMRTSDGAKFERDYPVRVDYQPIRVTLTTPQYRNNFYPGQDADTVAGEVTAFGGLDATVTLEGPGFPTRTAAVKGAGRISFDTRGFRDGEATLTVRTAKDVKTVRIRKLPPTKASMTWIADGALVVNGTPTLRRNVYALGYRCGTKVNELYKKEFAGLTTPLFDTYYDISIGRLMSGKPGVTVGENTRDVRPSPAYLAEIDRKIEELRGKEFGGYYISDEPECSGVSPVYLRYVYEHVAEKDPYHVIFMASRGGKAYLECADLIETHPYLSARMAPDGRRSYGTPPDRMGSYVDAFEAGNRPDKAIGYLPTCFSYRWSSTQEDYPTFDEYYLCTWAAMMRGGKTLWPYAGHDLYDRPALWIGTKYIFESFEALKDLVLFGKRTTVAKSAEAEAVLYALKDEQMLVAVNFTARPLEVELPETDDVFREFRGERVLDTRTKDGGRRTKVKLQPLETLVATTKPHDAGLRPFADIRRQALDEERARTSRDSQVLERYDDIDFRSNFSGVHGDGFYKVIDGMYEQLARESEWKDDCFIEMAFKNGLKPSVGAVRVHGRGLFDRAVVSVWEQDTWTRLAPKSVEKGEDVITLRFDRAVPVDRLRLDFPGDKGSRNKLEIFEIEIPKAND